MYTTVTCLQPCVVSFPFFVSPFSVIQIVLFDAESHSSYPKDPIYFSYQHLDYKNRRNNRFKIRLKNNKLWPMFTFVTWIFLVHLYLFEDTMVWDLKVKQTSWSWPNSQFTCEQPSSSLLKSCTYKLIDSPSLVLWPRYFKTPSAFSFLSCSAFFSASYSAFVFAPWSKIWAFNYYINHGWNFIASSTGIFIEQLIFSDHLGPQMTVVEDI